MFKLESITEADLGVVTDVTVTKDDFLLIGGRGLESEIDSRVQQIKQAIEESDSDYDKDKLQERCAKLSDGAAIIHVGGSSEMEVGEKKDRINDAMSATKAAIEQGIVPGGGVALLRCSTELDNVPEDINNDQKIGYDIVKKALSLPIKTIIENSGVQSDEIIAQVENAESKDVGYNVVSGKIENMIDAKVIDPTKVIISSLKSALNVASLLGTAEYVICEAPKSEDKSSNSAASSNGMMDY